MRTRATLTLAVLLMLSAAVAAWAARTETGDVFSVPLPPWSALYLIGGTNPGTVRVDGGTTVTEPAVALGGLPGSDGTLIVTGAGSRLDINGDPTNRSPNLSCANEGTCLVEVLDGGAISINGAGSEAGDSPSSGMQVGFEAGSLGTARVSGPGSFLGVENGAGDLPGLVVGFRGDGQFTVEDGASVVVDTGTGLTGGLVVGGAEEGDTSGVGRVTVTGAGSAFEMRGAHNSFLIGGASPGTLEVLDGASATGQVAFVGLRGSGDGTVRVGSGALLQVHGENLENGLGAQLLIGMGGNGNLEVIDGSVEIDDLGSALSSGLQVGGAGGGPFTAGTGTARVSGPAASVTVTGTNGFLAVGSDGNGTLLIEEGASVVVANPDDASGTSLGFFGGEGRVDVSGEGSELDGGVSFLLGVDLALNDTGSADLTVRDGASLLAGIGGIGMGSDAVLRGDGAVAAGGGLFNLRGRVEAGDPIGVLDVVGSYQQGEATAVTHVAWSDAGNSHLHATDVVDLLAGTVEVDLIGGFLPAAGDEFAVMGSNASLALDPSVTFRVRGAADGFDAELEANATQLIFRALSDAQGLGSCQGGQLKALGTLCKQVFACESKRAKKPAKDPDGSGLAGCVGKADDKFASAWDKNFQKASKKGDVCGIDSAQPAADVAAVLVGGPAAELTAAILTGWDETAEDKDDDKLRSSLLKEAGAHCSKLLTTDGKQMQKRNDAKRNSAREKARDRFEGKADKAIQKAGSRGVVYAGPDPATLADETTELVATATTATFNGVD
jgi:T5SS/PEP-CTERM-associated repeat protein